MSKITPRNFASLTTFIGVFLRRMLASGERKKKQEKGEEKRKKEKKTRTVDGNEHRQS